MNWKEIVIIKILCIIIRVLTDETWIVEELKHICNTISLKEGK